MQLKHSMLMLMGLALAWMACNKPSTTSTTPDSATISEEAGRGTSELKQAMLVCREIRDVNDDAPLAEVSVKIGDQTTVVDSVSVCQIFAPEEYPSHEIPKEALTACGGWWAGGGDYLYLIPDGDDAVVMAGWQEENQEDAGFHYKELRRFSRR